MHYVIATAKDGVIYWIHSKIYTTEKAARNMRNKKVDALQWNTNCKVYGIEQFNLITLEEK
jgi:hypothetical protein